MCGIYGGVFSDDPTADELDCFRKVGYSLKHRGPDENCEVKLERVLLGFNRLSIVDIQNGHQPITNLEKTVFLIGNGEIYNFETVKVKLEALGHTFSTNSDIECLLHSYIEYGDEFLDDIRGMFAFTIFNSRSGKILLGRDRLGEKPLYYAKTERSLWFASESTALLTSGVKNFSISQIGISMYLKYGFVTEAYPLINEISQVEPGTIVFVDLRDLSILTKSFWQIADFRDSISLNEKEKYCLELSEISRGIFQGDAKIGIALSGGLDSSLIVSIAAKQQKNVSVITIGYDSKKSFDESRAAENFSQSLGLDCTIRNISPHEVGSRFIELINAMDDPIADPSAFSYFVLGEEASKLNLKVLLSGHGPDEQFWGYGWITDLFYSTERRMKMYSEGVPFWSYIRASKIARYGVGPLIDGFRSGFGVLEGFRQFFEDRRSARELSYSIPVHSRAPGFRRKVKIGKKLGLDLKNGTDAVESIDFQDIQFAQSIVREILIETYLRVNGLAQIDRLWMANSIEGRSLLVDYKLVESALSDLENVTSILSDRKKRFKDFISDFLPAYKLNQQKKGFTPPVRWWYLEIFRQNKSQITNSMLVRDGLLSSEAQDFMRRPLTFIFRPKPLWLELVTLEFWYRKNFYPNRND